MEGEVITMDKATFGGFVAAERRHLGMTQAQLAEQLHVTDRAVSKWERGQSYPDVTLLEPLAAALHVGVEELLTCRHREETQTQSSLAIRSVLEISGEKKRLDKRRHLLAGAAAALLVLLALLSVAQHNGALLVAQRTTSPDGSLTLSFYRDRLINGTYCVKASRQLCLYAAGRICPYCRQGGKWTDRQRLDARLVSLDASAWSADGRYLLLRGGYRGNAMPDYIKLWRFTGDGKNLRMEILEVDACVLALLAGWHGDLYVPESALLPCLPGVTEARFLPEVHLSEAAWTGEGHTLSIRYDYTGTDGISRGGTLLYDADGEAILSVMELTGGQE